MISRPNVSASSQCRAQQHSLLDADRNDSALDVPRLGMTVAPADKVAGAGKVGVVVTKVDPTSAAAERGFKKSAAVVVAAADFHSDGSAVALRPPDGSLRFA